MKLYPYLFILLLLPWASPNAADTQKQQQLQHEIRQLSTNLSSQKNESQALQDEVTRLEQKLGNISNKNYETEKKIETTITKLAEANQKKVKLDVELTTQKSGLAQQLQALYSAGEQSHLRLLLRQDEPSDISRTIRYFEYLNENRVERIQGIQKTLGEIDAVRTSIEKDRISLQELTQTLEQQKADIESTLKARSTALANLKTDIRSNQKRLDKLKAEDAKFQAMLDRLAASQAAKAQETATVSRQPLPTKEEKKPVSGGRRSAPASPPTGLFPPCAASYPGQSKAKSSTAMVLHGMKNNAGKGSSLPLRAAPKSRPWPRGG
ncbi:MAG: hypothetical protein R3E93_02655 [Thiothrix sp.]